MKNIKTLWEIVLNNRSHSKCSANAQIGFNIYRFLPFSFISEKNPVFWNAYFRQPNAIRKFHVNFQTSAFFSFWKSGDPATRALGSDMATVGWSGVTAPPTGRAQALRVTEHPSTWGPWGSNISTMGLLLLWALAFVTSAAQPGYRDGWGHGQRIK